MSIKLAIEIDAELKRRAEMAALRNGDTLPNVVHAALTAYVDRYEMTEGKDIDANALAGITRQSIELSAAGRTRTVATVMDEIE